MNSMKCPITSPPTFCSSTCYGERQIFAVGPFVKCICRFLSQIASKAGRFSMSWRHSVSCRVGRTYGTHLAFSPVRWLVVHRVHSCRSRLCEADRFIFWDVGRMAAYFKGLYMLYMSGPVLILNTTIHLARWVYIQPNYYWFTFTIQTDTDETGKEQAPHSIKFTEKWFVYAFMLTD